MECSSVNAQGTPFLLECIRLRLGGTAVLEGCMGTFSILIKGH